MSPFEKVCIILLTNLLFYSKSLCYKYSSDDIPVYHKPPPYKNKLEKIFYWIEGSLRHHPQWDHALTMAIHSVVCVLVYLAFGKTDIAFLAALLFAFNPANNQGSIWISGRSYALSALGMLGAMAFPVLFFPFLLIATYYNQGFMAPLIFAFSNLYWFILGLPFIWALNLKRFKSNVEHKIKMEMLPEDKRFNLNKIIIAIKTFGFYTTIAIIPFKITFYHSFLQSMCGAGMKKALQWKDRFFFLGIVYIAAILYYWLYFTWNLASFGLLWWCFCLLPFLNIFRMSQEVAERYLYLPSIGLMYFLASIIWQNPVIVAIFMTMYLTRMWFVMDQYQDDYYLIEHSCLNSPDSWFSWHVRGIKRWDNQSHQEAVILWTMARILSPNEFKVNFNIATALKLSRRDKEAKQFLDIAKRNIPEGQEEQCNKVIKDFENGTCSILV